MCSVVGRVSRGSGWGERVKILGFSKLIEAHEGRGPLYIALSLARASDPSRPLATVSESALGGPLPGERGLASSFFSPLSPLASRDSRPRESTVDYYSWTRRLSWTRVYRHTKKLIRISHHAVSILAT